MSIYKENFKGVRYHSPHELPLKIKIAKILKKIGIPKCGVAFGKINAMNLKIIENKQSLPYVRKKIHQSRNFTYSQEIPPLRHFMDLGNFIPNYDEISKIFLTELKPEEIKLIKKDKDYYIKDKELLDNLRIFDLDPLFEKLNKEENEEEEKEDNIVTTRGANETSVSKYTSETPGKHKVKGKIAGDDDQKWIDTLIKDEIIKDKRKIRDMENQKKHIDVILNKIYYQSIEDLNNFSKVFKKIDTNRRNVVFLKENESGKKKEMKTIPNDEERCKVKMSLRPRMNKNKRNFIVEQGQTEQTTSEIQRKIKVIYELQKNKENLPKIY